MRKSHGATLVEMTFVLSLSVLMIGAFIDLGLGVYRYSAFTNFINGVARDVAVSQGSCRITCPNFSVKEVLSEPLAKEYDTYQALGLKLQLGFGSRLTTLQASGELPVKCIFCQFLREGSSYRSFGEMRLERLSCGGVRC
jgi:hypothetical protein